jgi:fatty acid-binding protein DegV
MMDLIPSPEQLIKEGRAVTKDSDWAESPISTQSIMEIGASTGGLVTIFTRVITRVKGIGKLIEIVKDRSRGGKLHAAIDYVGVPDEAEELKKRLLLQPQCAELYVTEESLIPSIHEGLGAIKIGWYEE